MSTPPVRLLPHDRGIDEVGRLLNEPANEESVDRMIASYLGDELEIRRFKLTASVDLRFTKVEIHDRSPQFSVAHEADWYIVVFPQGWEPGNDGKEGAAYRVPRGRPLLLQQGLWHCGMLATNDTSATVGFKAGTLEFESRVAELDQPISVVRGHE